MCNGSFIAYNISYNIMLCVYDFHKFLRKVYWAVVFDVAKVSFYGL